MADSITMTQFIAKVRHLGGFETEDEANAFITDANIEERGNANLRKVYLALVRARGHEYFRATTDITTSAGASTYALNVAMLALLSVSRLASNVSDQWELLWDFNESEQHDLDSWPLSRYGEVQRFQLRGNNLEVRPTPSASETLRVAYVPNFTPITRALGNAFDGIAGFEEWAVWETLAEFQAKDSSDWTLSMSKAKDWEREVESMASKRNFGMPRRVQRVRNRRRGRL
jgi:hypothetical protein